MAIREEELPFPEAFTAAEGGALYTFPAPGRVPQSRRRMLVRRRRTLAVSAAAVLAVAAVVMSTASTAPAPAPQAPRTLVLKPGDSLWGVAERFSPPGADLRAYVHSLIGLNHLQGRTPLPGLRLRLPSAS